MAILFNSYVKLPQDIAMVNPIQSLLNPFKSPFNHHCISESQSGVAGCLPLYAAAQSDGAAAACHWDDSPAAFFENHSRARY